MPAKDVATARGDRGVDLVENPYQAGTYQFTFSTKRGLFASSLPIINYVIELRPDAWVSLALAAR